MKSGQSHDRASSTPTSTARLVWALSKVVLAYAFVPVALILPLVLFYLITGDPEAPVIPRQLLSPLFGLFAAAGALSALAFIFLARRSALRHVAVSAIVLTLLATRDAELGALVVLFVAGQLTVALVFRHLDGRRRDAQALRQAFGGSRK